MNSEPTTLVPSPALPADDATTPEGTRRAVPRGRFAAWWGALTATVATVMGLLPHVLHHAGIVAGAVLVTGAAGNALFAALGFVLTVPLLRRLHRRYGTWKAPAVATLVFAAMFAFSTFVLGPALAGASSAGPDSDTGRHETPSQSPGPAPDTHSQHHQ